MRQKIRNRFLITPALGVMDMREIKSVTIVAEYCMVGSPEYRANFATENAMVSGKAKTALALTPPITKTESVQKGNYSEQGCPLRYGVRLFFKKIITLAKNAVTVAEGTWKPTTLSRLRGFLNRDTMLIMV